jgi:hypothetical protein
MEEEKVPEELEHVSVPCLRPDGVPEKFHQFLLMSQSLYNLPTWWKRKSRKSLSKYLAPVSAQVASMRSSINFYL